MPIVLEAAIGAVRRWLGSRRPVGAIVLGSGLGALAESLRDPIRLPYSAIPGFPEATVPGHFGELIAGTLGGREVLCQSGRFHSYEGQGSATVALPVRIFGAIGTSVVILTNAAGGIRRSFRPGTLMLIADQMNLNFGNPLIGPVLATETRFPDMSGPYDAGLRNAARAVSLELGIVLNDGVYAGVSGPSYETPAEIRWLERAGADAVGMSTVLEVVAARALGLRCLGISIIANRASGIASGAVSHGDVLAAAGGASADLKRLVNGVLERLSE
jgi:purine-nucleoside phosphorylase